MQALSAALLAPRIPVGSERVVSSSTQAVRLRAASAAAVILVRLFISIDSVC
jgi:hypothetical protein